MAKALEADQPRPSGWSALMGLTRDYRGKMILLGLASFAGAMLEAGFLVLLTSTVLAMAAGRDTITLGIGPLFPVTAALVTAGAAVVVRLVFSMATVQISASLSALVRTEQRVRVAQAFLQADWGVQQGEAAGRL